MYCGGWRVRGGQKSSLKMRATLFFLLCKQLQLLFVGTISLGVAKLFRPLISSENLAWRSINSFEFDVKSFLPQILVVIYVSQERENWCHHNKIMTWWWSYSLGWNAPTGWPCNFLMDAVFYVAAPEKNQAAVLKRHFLSYWRLALTCSNDLYWLFYNMSNQPKVNFKVKSKIYKYIQHQEW